MPSTPIAYNPSLAAISGTQQVGSLAVGTSAQAYSTKPGGVVWWMSPDTASGYVISAPRAGQPNQTADTGTVRFWRSKLKTDASFLELVNKLSKKFGGGVLANVTAADTWLTSNGYWTTWVGSSFDADAQAFITAADITNSTQQTAINTLVVGLKADSLWAKIGVMYPFVGGTATSHTYNLKSPGSYTLTFYGEWTHSSTGALPNGTNAYAETGYSDGPDGINSHRAFYSRQNINSTGFDIGVSYGYSDGESGNVFVNSLNIGTIYFQNQLGDSYTYGGWYGSLSTDALGLFVASRTGSGLGGLDMLSYKRGTLINTVNTYSFGDHNNTTYKPFVLSAIHRYYDDPVASTDSVDSYNNRQQSFVSLGAGLTSTEVANLYNRIQAFQTSLGRQV